MTEELASFKQQSLLLGGASMGVLLWEESLQKSPFPNDPDAGTSPPARLQLWVLCLMQINRKKRIIAILIIWLSHAVTLHWQHFPEAISVSWAGHGWPICLRLGMYKGLTNIKYRAVWQKGTTGNVVKEINVYSTQIIPNYDRLTQTVTGKDAAKLPAELYATHPVIAHCHCVMAQLPSFFGTVNRRTTRSGRME